MRRRCAAEREVFVLNHKKGCYYCERDAAFQELLFELCDLRISKVFLCKDQTLPGRCTIMFDGGHYDELYQIPKAERDLFLDDVCLLAQTIQELFHADKINYAISRSAPNIAARSALANRSFSSRILRCAYI